MTAMPKNVSKQSVKQVGNKPPVVESFRNLGMLDYDSANRTARRSQDVAQSADMHSSRNAAKSEHYHAKIIGQAVPQAATGMQSPRPGLTANL